MRIYSAILITLLIIFLLAQLLRKTYSATKKRNAWLPIFFFETIFIEKKISGEKSKRLRDSDNLRLRISIRGAHNSITNKLRHDRRTNALPAIASFFFFFFFLLLMKRNRLRAREVCAKFHAKLKNFPATSRQLLSSCTLERRAKHACKELCARFT